MAVQLTDDQIADIQRLFLNEGVIIGASKPKQAVYANDTQRWVIVSEDGESIVFGVSDDSKQMLLAGPQVATGAKTFDAGAVVNQAFSVNTRGRMNSAQFSKQGTETVGGANEGAAPNVTFTDEAEIIFNPASASVSFFNLPVPAAVGTWVLLKNNSATVSVTIGLAANFVDGQPLVIAPKKSIMVRGDGSLWWPQAGHEVGAASLAANQAIFTNSGGNFVSNPISGSGNVAMTEDVTFNQDFTIDQDAGGIFRHHIFPYPGGTPVTPYSIQQDTFNLFEITNHDGVALRWGGDDLNPSYHFDGTGRMDIDGDVYVNSNLILPNGDITLDAGAGIITSGSGRQLSMNVDGFEGARIRTNSLHQFSGVTNSSLNLGGSGALFQGSTITLNGSTHPTQPSRTTIWHDGTESAWWDENGELHQFFDMHLTGNILGRTITSETVFSGSTSADAGGNIIVHAENHATSPNQVHIRSGTTLLTYWNASGYLTTTTSAIIEGQLFVQDSVLTVDNTSELYVSGGAAFNLGANFVLHGNAHATNASELLVRNGTQVNSYWDAAGDFYHNYDFFVTGQIRSNSGGGSGSASFLASSSSPSYEWNETDAGVDSKNWDLIANAGILSLRALNDPYSATSTVWSVNRTGFTPDTFSLNPLLFANGGVEFGFGVDSVGRIFRSTVSGLKNRGVTGTSYDWSVFSPANTAILYNPTGTNNFQFVGDIVLNGALIGNSTVQTTNISGGTSITTGGNIILYGPSHATAPGETWIRNGTSVSCYWDATGNFFQNYDSTFAGDADIAGTLTLSHPTQDYLFQGRGAALTLQGQSVGTGALVELFGYDGNEGVDVAFSAYGLGTPGSITNHHRLRMGWETTGTYYELGVRGTGTFTAPDLRLWGGSDSNIGQLDLIADGSIESSGNIDATSFSTGDEAFTYTKGNFTGTYTGFTTSPTQTIYWVKMGDFVSLYIRFATSATSNATSFTITGLPASIRPANDQTVPIGKATDNALIVDCQARINTSGVIEFETDAGSGFDPTAWTSTGTKGHAGTISLTYNLLI